MSKPVDHFIVMSHAWPGYWGRGKTITAAVKAAEWLQDGDKVVLCPCDKDAYVDHSATLFRETATPCEFGTLKEVRAPRGKGGKLEWQVIDRRPAEPNKKD